MIEITAEDEALARRYTRAVQRHDQAARYAEAVESDYHASYYALHQANARLIERQEQLDRVHLETLERIVQHGVSRADVSQMLHELGYDVLVRLDREGAEEC